METGSDTPKSHRHVFSWSPLRNIRNGFCFKPRNWTTFNGQTQEKDTSYDKYGFLLLSESQSDKEFLRCHDYMEKTLDAKSDSQWNHLLDSWEEGIITDNNKELLSLMRTGVPHKYRPLLWRKLLSVDTLAMTANFSYKANLDLVRAQLVELDISEYGGSHSLDVLSENEFTKLKTRRHGQLSMDTIRHILLDLERTFPTQRMFSGSSPEAKEGRASMFRVLAVYARYNPQVEYCQGMSYIAGMFLLCMSEVEAFWCLVSMLERHKYMAGYFHGSMERLRCHGGIFQRLLGNHLPELVDHFAALGVDPLMYLTPWLLCVFTSLSCWETTLAIWDLLLLKGVKAMYMTSLALLQLLRDDLMRSQELCTVLPLLLHPPTPLVRPEVLIPIIWSIEIADEDLADLQEPSELGSRKRRLSAGKENTTNGIENTSIFKRVMNMFISRGSTSQSSQHTPKSNKAKARLRQANSAKRRSQSRVRTPQSAVPPGASRYPRRIVRPAVLPSPAENGDNMRNGSCSPRTKRLKTV